MMGRPSANGERSHHFTLERATFFGDGNHVNPAVVLLSFLALFACFLGEAIYHLLLYLVTIAHQPGAFLPRRPIFSEDL